MHIIRGLHNLNQLPQGCVATIGNFDGLHLGHQAIFRNVALLAAQLQLPPVVVIFEPQPREFFLKDKSPARLTRLREKLFFMAKYGITQAGIPDTQVLCLHFNQKLAQLAPPDFVKTILIDNLQVKYLMVGEDFRFGYQRQGDFKLLQSIAAKSNFVVEACPTIILAGEKVSSTRVREALQQGNLDQVEQLLGRPYSMCGRVAHGDKRGRQWGIPTANIYLHRKVSPIKGVYTVAVAGLGAGLVFGVANVGNRPTVSGTRCLLEVYLFNFDREIYGEYIEVKFLTKLRDERRFETLELLKQQIFEDIEQAKDYFNKGVTINGRL